MKQISSQYYMYFENNTFKKGELLRTSLYCKVLVLRSYNTWFWRLLYKLGISSAKPNYIKVKQL